MQNWKEISIFPLIRSSAWYSHRTLHSWSSLRLTEFLILFCIYSGAESKATTNVPNEYDSIKQSRKESRDYANQVCQTFQTAGQDKCNCDKENVSKYFRIFRRFISYISFQYKLTNIYFCQFEYHKLKCSCETKIQNCKKSSK